MTTPKLCTLCGERPVKDPLKSTYCALCDAEARRYPCAFRDDLGVWEVTVYQKPPNPRWQKVQITPATATVVVIAPDEATAIVRSTRPGWLVIKARVRHLDIVLPACTTCGAAINGGGKTSLCRKCAAFKSPKQQKPRPTVCIDCKKPLKGTGISSRCLSCSGKATRNGTQQRVQGQRGTICTACGEESISEQSRTGYCRYCGNSQRMCVLCGETPLRKTNTSGHCRSCGQKEADRVTLERRIRAKELAA